MAKPLRSSEALIQSACTAFDQHSATQELTVKLHVLFAQRKERYHGEYAPESLACMTEYGQDENPEYLPAEQAKAEASGEFRSTAVVTLEFSGKELERLLNPTSVVLPAAIVPTE